MNWLRQAALAAYEDKVKSDMETHQRWLRLDAATVLTLMRLVLGDVELTPREFVSIIVDDIKPGNGRALHQMACDGREFGLKSGAFVRRGDDLHLCIPISKDCVNDCGIREGSSWLIDSRIRSLADLGAFLSVEDMEDPFEETQNT